VLKISEERRVVLALLILAVVALASIFLALGRQAANQEEFAPPVEGPPTPACNALTNFNFADLLAVRLAASDNFSPDDPKIEERLTRLAKVQTTVATDAPDYAERAMLRLTFIQHTLRDEKISDDERNDALQASEEMVTAQRKICPAAKTTNTKKPGTTAKGTAATTTAP
jgi:hypothetical protein